VNQDVEKYDIFDGEGEEFAVLLNEMYLALFAGTWESVEGWVHITYCHSVLKKTIPLEKGV